MNKNVLFIILTTALLAAGSFPAGAQTVSTFEDLTLSPNSFWNGSDFPLGTTFINGNAVFPNYYDTAYGGLWTGGWAYSSMQDSITAGFLNLYSARPAAGYGNSPNYAVGQQGSVIRLNAAAAGKAVNGFFVTNGTYTALSMRDGDLYAKKFGGESGNDPDWFKLTVRKWFAGEMTDDSVEFYLADFRFEENALDYIVTTWQWLDLTPLGNADSLKFILASSDAGQWGMNTPAFFCIDNFTTADSYSSVHDRTVANSSIAVYPNPVDNMVNIDLSDLPEKDYEIKITDLTGKVVCYGESGFQAKFSFDISNLCPGAYFIRIMGVRSVYFKSIIKR